MPDSFDHFARIPRPALLVATLLLSGILTVPARGAEDDEVIQPGVQLQIADPRGHNLPDAKPDPDAPVHVFVVDRKLGGKTLYDYRVVNDSPYRLNEVRIGFDQFRGDNEITQVPSGYRESDSSAAGLSAPSGWHARVLPMEDTILFHMEWVPDDPDGGIPPGGSLEGFRVLVDAEDPLYEHGHFTMFSSGGKEGIFNDLIGEPDSPEAPSAKRSRNLSVETTSNGVRASFAASCDCPVTVDVLNASGRRVVRLLDGPARRGENVTVWNGRDAAGQAAPEGTYFLRVKTRTSDRFSRFTLP